MSRKRFASASCRADHPSASLTRPQSALSMVGRTRPSSGYSIACSRSQAMWRAQEDLNLRPSAPQADALSTELWARVGARFHSRACASPSAENIADFSGRLWLSQSLLWGERPQSRARGPCCPFLSATLLVLSGSASRMTGWIVRPFALCGGCPAETRTRNQRDISSPL
jgi:hypothetical protein